MGTAVGQTEIIAGLRSGDVPVDIRVAGKKVLRGQNVKGEIAFPNEAIAHEILGSRDAYVLAEAYVNGLMEIQGDIYSAIQIKDKFYPERLTVLDKAKIVYSFLRNSHRHTVPNDSKFISHHYEHPDEFYELFLGDNMTYSCAFFAKDSDTLDQAQERKIDYLLTKLRLQEGETLLDIGCGWGSLVVRAARDFGAQALGITLSKTQHEYANQRIKEQGLEGVCRIELLDYRVLDSRSQFDKIISVGMYEHVGGRNLNLYFNKIFDLLRPEGLFVNHGITRQIRADWRKASEALFINKYIFPGGELHPSNRVVEGMEAAGFEVFDVESLRKHYVKTLKRWVSNLQKNHDQALEIVPERVFRAWVLYMAGCALTFEEGYLNIHQVCGSKSEIFGGRQIAMTRAHLNDFWES